MGVLATLTNVILILAVVAVAIVCGLAAAEACGNIKAFGFETDDDLRSARAYGAGAASIALIVSISSFIGMIALMFTPAIKAHSTKILYLVIFGNIAALVGVSILAGIGAKGLGDWLLVHDDVEGLIGAAKTNLVWSCALAVVALVLLLVYFIYEYISNKKEKEKLQESLR